MSRARESSVETAAERRFLISAVSAVLGGGITVAQHLTASMGREAPSISFDLYCSHRDVAEHSYPGNVRVHFLPGLASRGARWRWEQFELPRIASRKEFDAVLQLGGYLSFATRIPQVAVWQNPNVFTPPGIRRPLREQLLVRAQRLAQSLSMRLADQNVFLTENSVELASRWWPMHKIRHRVIHSGVDIDRVVSREPVPLEDREEFALSVGHTYSHKNYETLIDAMHEYRRRFDDPLRLKIVGAPANQNYYDDLVRRIKERQLEHVVTMVGPASLDQVLNLMSKAKVYVVTSLLETFGLTMFEAMGRGLPVVASDATCHPEVCGDAALYCDPRDPVDVAEKVHRLATDPEAASAFRRRGFDRVREFSWDRAAQKYLDVLKLAGTASRHTH